MLKKKLLLFSILPVLLTFAACKKEIDVFNNDYQTLGTSAHGLLSSNQFISLNVEINYMPGYKPDSNVVSALNSFLNTYLNKPGGIQILQKQIAASSKAILTLKEIVAVEKLNRTAFTKYNEIAVYILIADANFSDSTVFATSYWNTSFCLFGKNIFINSGGATQVKRTTLFSTLMEHEFGHLLGLVGQGSPMQLEHKDIANGAHCNNPDCLMYYGVETSDNMALPVSFIASLDANCTADLKANGSK
ncbi:MAG: hypothetical protein ABIN89_26695 [Chitinophagaceae bacterium]